MMQTNPPTQASGSRNAALIAEHFLLFLGALEAGVVVEDGSGATVYANEAAAALLGFPSAAALLGLELKAAIAAFEIVDDRGAPTKLAECGAALEGAPRKLLLIQQRATAHERSVTVQRRRVALGDATFVVNTFHESSEVSPGLTAQREAELLNQEYRARLELALAAGKLAAWEWRIQENGVPARERMQGVFAGSSPGTLEPSEADIHPEDREQVFASMERAVRERADHSVTYRVVRHDGEVRWLEAFGKLVCDAGGAPLRLAGVCRDVTPQKEAEALRARTLAAEAASAEAQRSRRKFVDILESITDPFLVLDDALRITFINRAGAELGGFDRAAALGKRPWELIPAVAESAFAAAYERVARERKHVLIEEYFAPWERWFEASIFPLEEGVAAYTRDITEKKQGELLRERLASYAALRADVNAALASERDPRRMLAACCEALVRHMGVAFARIWTVDPSGTTLLLQASAGLYTHTDGPHGEVPIGKFKIGRIAAERSAHLTNDVPNDPWVSNPEWAKREGMVSFAGYPIVVDDRLLGVLAMFGRTALETDALAALGAMVDTVGQGIARRQAERELEQNVQELARSNSELEQFAYVASHDLQEPLRMVASYNQLLARRYKGKLDSDADDFIGFTVEGVTRMQRLINDLLAYSRVGTRGREFTEVDLGEVFAAVKQNLERAIVDEQATVTHDALPKVRGDEGQLSQLLQNLLSNAIKFRREEPPRVHVSARPGKGEWVVSVADNGIGIEPQYFDRVFVIFQRLHARDKYPGTGIGLAICKKIVERHGGRVWVDSTPGQGATFNFSIPFPKPPPLTARNSS